MLLKYCRGLKKKFKKVKRSISCSSRMAEDAGAQRGRKSQGWAVNAPLPRQQPEPCDSRVTLGGRMLVASRDRVATVHLCPPPGSEGDGCRGPPGRVCVSRRRGGAGSARDSSSRPQLLPSPELGTAGGANNCCRNTRVSSEERPRSVSSRGCEQRGGER